MKMKVNKCFGIVYTSTNNDEWFTVDAQPLYRSESAAQLALNALVKPNMVGVYSIVTFVREKR